MKLGLSTLISSRSSPEDTLRVAADLDLEFVEILFDMPHFQPTRSPSRLNDLRNMLESFEFRVLVHGNFWDLNPVSHYRSIRDFTHRRVEESIQTCSTLGGEILTIHPGRCYFKEDQELLQRCRKWFEEFIKSTGKLAEEQGISLAIETGAHSADIPENLEEFKEVLGMRENLGITLDIGHVFIYLCGKEEEHPEASIAEFVDKAGDRLFNIHLHDNCGRYDDHLIPGDGKIEFQPIIESIKGSYSGPVILELWGFSEPYKTARKGVKIAREMSNRN